MGSQPTHGRHNKGYDKGYSANPDVIPCICPIEVADYRKKEKEYCEEIDYQRLEIRPCAMERTMNEMRNVCSDCRGQTTIRSRRRERGYFSV
mmetsp:Transcript_51853/g.155621  ORF Transcript_51853/g.155621 Transcript_51853/m.155621 type:complete len:92 (+) Transcript_51853:277-552(+)